ncbi:MAG: ABC transporter permease [Bacillota bacterium]
MIKKIKKKIKDHLPVLVFFFLLILIWEFVVSFFDIETWILPAPGRIINEIIETRALLFRHSLRTLFESIFGLIISSIAGIITGVIIFHFDILKRTFYPLLVVSQTVPIVILIPLLVIWFGFGILPKILIVILACFFPAAVNTIDGLSTADNDMINLLKSMGATNWQVFTKVRVPAALPMIFSGLRISATYAVMAAVVAEWMGSDMGLGVFIVRSSNSYLTARVFAGIVFISLFSILLFKSVDLLEKILVPWKEQKREEI